MQPSRYVEGLPAYYFEDLSLGMMGEYGKVIGQAEVARFAELSGDFNPLHFSPEFAKGTIFKTPIVHGMLTASMISTVIGSRMPGPGCIYISQELRFKAPVRAGDYVVARAVVEALHEERKRVTFRTSCWVGDKIVIDGEALIQVPSRG
ncbi:MAG: MaoC family dehydratase [Alphaproteobacteria bacterium]